MATDQNFETLADRYTHELYGTYKERLRQKLLQEDLNARLKLTQRSPISVLDLAGGLGQMSIWLAKCGHHVTLLDIAPAMLSRAEQAAKDAQVLDRIRIVQSPLQMADEVLEDEQFDLVLVHAALEWLADPRDGLHHAQRRVRPGASLSLAIYNEYASLLHNAIAGRLDLVLNPEPAECNELTPQNPLNPQHIKGWFDPLRWSLRHERGLRCLVDYIVGEQADDFDEALLLAIEHKYSDRQPFTYMARYVHQLWHRR